MHDDMNDVRRKQYKNHVVKRNVKTGDLPPAEVSPLARALRGASLGDLRTVRLPSGVKEWEVAGIAYE